MEAKDKNTLLESIRKFPDGIAVADLKDAYPTVREDLQALKDDGHIVLLSDDVAYPNDPTTDIRVDDDLKTLYHEIKLPKDMIDIARDLKKHGIKPATSTTPTKRKSTTPTKRKRE